jgi:integrase
MSTLYKRGSTWWIKYSIDGKARYESLRTKNRTVARREQQAIEAKLLEPHRHFRPGRDITAEVFWPKYLAWAREHKRPRSIETEQNFWRQFIEFTGAMRLGDITTDHIERWKTHKRADGWSDVTINGSLKDLQSILNRAIKLELFDGQNPFIGIKRFRIEKRIPEFHSQEELVRILECAKSHSRVVEWAVLLGGWAGLRKNELANARWEWFDFDKKRPVINVRSFEGFGIKDHEERAIPMAQRIFDSFCPHRKESGFVFSGQEGNSRYRFDPRRGLEACLREANVRTDKPYQRLRMSFGSILVQNGVSIFKVSKWLGHSSVAVTERHYVGIQAYDPDINSF